MISIFPSDHCRGIDGVAAAARRLGKTARVHVKVDSGFGRNGFTPATFDAALAKLVPLAKEGVLHIVGQWSHLAVADAPDVPEFVASTDRQIENFKDFTRRMEQAALRRRFVISPIPLPRFHVPRFILS